MNKKKFLTTFFIAFGGGILAIGTTGLISKATYKRTSVQPGIPVQYAAYTAPKTIPSGNLDFTNAASLSVHAVVHIKTEYEQKTTTYNDFFGGLFNPWGIYNSPNTAPVTASGSGVILSEDGYIVTNNHVVQDATSIEVTLNDKRTYEAKLIGNDEGTDLALIKIEESGLPYLSYGNSDSVKVGEWVLAVGNPFNLTSTVTAGIISAKARNLKILGKNSSIETFLQTDAAVNPGNSGGALVNTEGKLVGINAAIASASTGSYIGYSFAIPVNIVRKVVDDLLVYGEIQRCYLGITPEEIDSKIAKEKGLSVVKGINVSKVTENSGAFDAGIKEGDVITKIGSTDVNSLSELQEAILIHKPGDKVVVSYIRDGEDKDVTVTLKNIDGSTGIVKKDEKSIVTSLGATFEVAGKDDLKRLGLTYGLKVTKVDAGLFRNAGIKVGFIVTGIDRKPVKTKEDIIAALKDKKGGVLIEGYYPNGMKSYYGFGM